MTLTRRTLLQSLASLLPLSALGLGRAPTLPISRLPEPAGGGDTITIRCSCGGTFEEPVDGILSRPISQFNTGSHGGCSLPEGFKNQVHDSLARHRGWPELLSGKLGSYRGYSDNLTRGVKGLPE